VTRILVVAAHPDDEVLGCGGLLARTLREGGEATVLVVTEGATTQYPGREDLVERKEEEARNAMRVLGGAAIVFLGLPDMRLTTLPPAEIAVPIADAVRARRPDWVLTHSPRDLNSDHRVVHEATRVACRPTPGHLPRLLSYEVLSSSEWGYGNFDPTFFVALADEDVERKIAAFGAYRTEVRPWPHPRSPEAICNLCRVRGSQIGVGAAEAFRLEWDRY
jgi:LmbE family N-acetylglucosaminyl deacetylase